ncbi:hypothetical protein CANARDRAFT_180421, partial [[Candida] arabinofermentans NRRL YB-2248]
DLEEERILKLLEQQQLEHQKTLTSEEIEFNSLSEKTRLKKLDELLTRSKLYSSIIADNLMESANTKKVQPTITDLMISDKTKKTKQNLADAASTEKQHNRQPSLITGCIMKDYQISGMEWLITLYQNGLNGILADEMGLGKTLQSISLLAFLVEQGIEGPFLICCPLSTVSNWLNEFAKFAPTLSVLGYTGVKEDRPKLRKLKGGFKNFNVVVTSYEMAIVDFKYLNSASWKYLIVDEGHRLKNFQCKLVRQLKRLDTSNRLLLTGTPLQNNLDELWSLLNFILPEIFYDIDMFQQWFDFSAFENLKDENSDQNSSVNKLINEKIQEGLVTSLHSILKPFLLRRLKRDVIKTLPPKREYLIYCKLTETQELLYKSILQKNSLPVITGLMFKEYLRCNDLIKNKRRYNDEVIDNFIESQLNVKKLDDDYKTPIFDKQLSPHWDFVVQNMKHKTLQFPLMQLRLVCNSPLLFFYPWNDDVVPDKSFYENSSKLQIIKQLVPELLKERRKLLIFSQFTTMLDIIEQFLEDFLNLETCRIDGNSSQVDRKEQIERFNSIDSEVDVFLLSTKAGGLGINLTAADTVILFDSDWNPQNDIQAMDRVHRIGQTKPVIIYRLVNANTIEEVMLAKADSKRNLEKLVIQLGDFDQSLFEKNKFRVGDRDYNTNILAGLKKMFNSSGLINDRDDLIDNTLLSSELKELLDRSDSAYTNAKQQNELNHPHINLFETVTS